MKVSFVIPAHNSALYLPQAVRSVELQTHTDWEMVIVNDGSTDETSEFLSWLSGKYAGSDKCVIINNEHNHGRSYSRNLGNARAAGKLLLVLDADDLATPKRAEFTIRKFNETGASFICGGSSVMDAIGRQLGQFKTEPFNMVEALKRKANLIVHSTVAYTPSLAAHYPYREGEVCKLGIDDWAQQIEVAMGKQDKMEYCPQTLANYRVNEEGITVQRNKAAVNAAKDEFLRQFVKVECTA